jgi:hypothetical protein
MFSSNWPGLRRRTGKKKVPAMPCARASPSRIVTFPDGLPWTGRWMFSESWPEYPQTPGLVLRLIHMLRRPGCRESTIHDLKRIMARITHMLRTHNLEHGIDRPALRPDARHSESPPPTPSASFRASGRNETWQRQAAGRPQGRSPSTSLLFFVSLADGREGGSKAMPRPSPPTTTTDTARTARPAYHELQPLSSPTPSAVLTPWTAGQYHYLCQARPPHPYGRAL